MLEPIYHSRPNLDQSESEALAKVVQTNYLAKGKICQEFEEKLAERYNRKYAVYVSSGMAALHLCLHNLNLNANSEVCLPSYVCTALLNAIHLTGAKPKLVDTTHHGFLMDPDLCKQKTDVIIYPQLLGAQTQLIPNKQAFLIEDCAMSMGKNALSQGDVSIASFYATKMMTTGQGGAIFTDQEQLADAYRDLISYDNREDYQLRFNYAPTDLGAAIGLVQLDKLDLMIQQRQELSQEYDDLFKSTHPDLLYLKEGLTNHYPALFRYWIKSSRKESIQKHLEKQNIESKSPVYKPLHRYLSLSDRSFPNTSQAQDQILSLPFYPALKKVDLKRVVDEISKSLA